MREWGGGRQLADALELDKGVASGAMRGGAGYEGGGTESWRTQSILSSGYADADTITQQGSAGCMEAGGL